MFSRQRHPRRSPPSAFGWALSGLVLLAIDAGANDAASAAAPPAASTPARLVNIGDCRPQYPPESLKAGEAGVTRLRMQIGADGALRNVSVLGSSGSSRLDAAAADALGRCRFVAATRAGVPIEAAFTLEYKWRIELPGPALAMRRCNVEYPEESVRAEEQGKTTLSFRLNAAGEAHDIEVAESSGFQRLDAASIATLRRCPFKPTDATSPAQRFKVEYVWRLQDGLPASAPLGPEAPDPYRPGL